MASKAKLSLLVFLLSFLLLSTALCLGQTDPQQELEQCKQLCARQQRFRQQQCEQQCQERFEEQRSEQGRDESTRDPQQEYLQCQRTCQQQERSQQQQCQQRCEERRRQQEREQQRDEQSPQREYQQCQRRCQQQQQQPGQQQQQCEQRCEERRRQQEREQQRDEQSPQREYQQCQRRCQQQQPGQQQQQQQQQCEQRCEERRTQREREQQRDEQSPQREYQQCQHRCQQQQPDQQQQCEQRCEEKRRQHEREEHRDEQSPQREYQQCQRRCQQQQPGQQQQQCEQRCEERRRQQEREQQRDEQSPRRKYQQCQHRCQQQPGQQQQQCEQRCEERRMQQEREQQRDEQSPQIEYQQCQRRCQQPGQQQCEQRCEERRTQQEKEQQRDEKSPQREYQQCQRHCQQQPGQQQCEQRCVERRRQQEREHRDERHGSNPYFFDEQSFIDRYRSQEGYNKVLPKFTEKSNLLRGIENYRLAIFQANPNTFVIPSHWDADVVLFVVKGKGTISLVRQQNRESYNLKQGDVLRVPVGSLVYMINKDNSQTLQIAKIFVTVSTPGQVKEFFSSGDHEPESFYKAFSNDILESAFNTPRERLDRLFGQQTQGVIIKASQEQVRELSRHASSSSEGSHFWPKKGGQSSGGPFNILNKRATYSNNYGQLYEADGNDYRQLQDLDLGVSFTNISQGGMLGPYYNTRSTKVLLVVEGNGRFEMACPHLSKQSQQQHRGSQEFEEEQEQGQGIHYEKVSATLSPQTIFIVPAGHPVAIVASQNQNLQIVAFEINAQENQRNFLAGKESVINQMEKVAMELGFNVPSSEVQEILNKQRESFFLPGPNQRQQQRGSHGLSILDFVGF